MKLFYIGRDFYLKSSTMMSSIYEENGGRSDWGKVEMALERGEEVHIRQATDKELLWAYKKLDEINKKEN